MAFTLCVQAAIPNTPLTSATAGTTIGADGNDGALVTVVISGDNPGSELGGEPSAVVFTFTKLPQLNAPGSVGGVTTGTMRPMSALAGLGLVLGRWSTLSSWRIRGLRT